MGKEITQERKVEIVRSVGIYATFTYFPGDCLATHLNNYARLTEHAVISTDRRATIIATNSESSSGYRSNYDRIFFLIKIDHGNLHFVNISNANKQLVSLIEEEDTDIKATVSLNRLGEIVQVNYPLTAD